MSLVIAGLLAGECRVTAKSLLAVIGDCRKHLVKPILPT